MHGFTEGNSDGTVTPGLLVCVNSISFREGGVRVRGLRLSWLIHGCVVELGMALTPSVAHVLSVDTDPVISGS